MQPFDAFSERKAIQKAETTEPSKRATAKKAVPLPTSDPHASSQEKTTFQSKKVTLEELHSLRERSRSRERELHIKGEQNVLKEFCKAHALELSTQKLQSFIQQSSFGDEEQILKDNILRIFDKLSKNSAVSLLLRQDQEILLEDFFSSLQTLQKRDINLDLTPIIAQMLNEHFTIEPDLRQQVASQIASDLRLIHSSTLQISYNELQKGIAALAERLATPYDQIKDPKKFHLGVLKNVRALLKNPAYKLLRTQEEHPCVEFLHNLCRASYKNGASALAYHETGKELIQLCIKSDMPVGKKLKALWDGMKDIGIASNNRDFLFRSTQFFTTLGMAAKAILANIPIMLHLPQAIQAFFPQEDQALMYENISGSVFTEHQISHGKMVEIHTVYNPGPTVGIVASPEFRAVLQSMENRHFSPKEGVESGWLYTNLQDISSTLENPQTAALMKLGKEFPFSFYGITIAQNNPLMLGRKEQKFAFNEAYLQRFLESVLNENNFKLENRRRDVGGHYFFPIREEMRLRWNEEVEKIVIQAFRIVQEAQSRATFPLTAEENAMFLSAFRELSHMGIIALYERLVVDSQMQKIQAPLSFFRSNICRSGIDRGGKKNAQDLFGNPVQGEEIDENLVTELAIMRPWNTRERLGLEQNLNELINFTTAVDRQAVRDFMQSIQVGKTETRGISLPKLD